MADRFLPVRGLALALAALLMATPALADKDAGGKHGNKHRDKWEKKAEKEDRKDEKEERKAERKADKHEAKHAKRDDDDDRRHPRHGAYFNDRHRDSVRHYYTSDHHGRCPPGLAKKNNGCMPPGHARNWQVGHRLPPSVVVYSVPQPILVTLPPPPPQHRYVRVAGDILLIAVGTSMVVDGINGVMR